MCGLFFRVADRASSPLSRKPAPEGVIPLDKDGLKGSVDWHREKKTVEKKTLTTRGRNPLDRALLAQTVQNYKRLEKAFPTIESITRRPSFGENLIINGFASSDVCVGDVFHVLREIDGSESVVAVIQVGNPRRPCHLIKSEHSQEVCHYSASHALAGLFFRVLQPGSICEGDRIKLHERIHPKWNLEKIAKLFYSETNLAYKIPRWTGKEEEIQEILDIPELSMYWYGIESLYYC